MNDGASLSREVEPELHATLMRLRTILQEYRSELQTSEENFRAWQEDWHSPRARNRAANEYYRSPAVPSGDRAAVGPCPCR